MVNLLHYLLPAVAISLCCVVRGSIASMPNFVRVDVQVIAAVHLITSPMIAQVVGFEFFNVVNDAFGWEHCGKDSKWITNDIAGLKRDLLTKLHGQHLVAETVVSMVAGHVYDDNPSKALVLSFHGPSGVGKNFVSTIIAENIFEKKEVSKFRHLRVATVHFADFDRVNNYRAAVKQLVTDEVKKCSRSIFIFDEVEKMPSGVMDILKPFLDYHSHIDGVDYRKAIFIFLSNGAGSAITSITLNHWKLGKPREQLRLRDFETAIERATINENGGLKHNWLIDRHLVSAYIPFLPLQRDHVRLCIRDYASSKGIYLSQAVVNCVVDELTYFPREEELFSTSGCKRISEKVNFCRISSRSDL